MIYPHQLLGIAGWGVILGLLLGGYVEASLLLVVSSLVLIGVFLWHKKTFPVIALFLLALVLGHLRYTGVVTALSSQEVPSGDVMVIGTIASDVAISGASQSFDLQVTTIDEKPAKFRSRIQLWSRDKLQYRDRLEALISIEPLVETYYFQDGVVAKGQTVDLVEVDTPTTPLPKRSLYFLRDSIAAKINSFLGESSSSLVNGLLLGLRQDLSEEFKTALRNSGTTHIVALSGFNITIIIAFLLALLRGLPRKTVYLISALAILAFVIMTGAASSVVRAGIMGGIYLLASIWSRRRHAGNALLVAVVAMAFVNPLILQYDIGFQLSMAATLGLIYISPHLTSRLPKKALFEIAATTIAASLATLPLLIYHFGGISLISLAANLLVVPLVPIVMLLGFVGLILNLFGNFWAPLNFLIELPAVLLIKIVTFFGSLPHAYIQLPPLSPWLVAFYYCGMVGILLKFYDRKHRSLY